MTLVKSIAMYASGTVVASYLMFRAYIAIKYPFWTKQPVFFPWNFTYWFRAPFVINEGTVEPTKYTNFVDISFSSLTPGDSAEIGELTQLVNKQYLQTEDCKYNPSKDVMSAMFAGHSHDCYVSLYKAAIKVNHAKFKEGNKKEIPKGPATFSQEVVGTMTTRPVKLRIKNKEMPAYYVDLLCVHADFRKKRIANQIIETHHYYQRKNNPKIKVSLFKREGMLMRSMPLCEFPTLCFKLSTLMTSVGDLIYKPLKREKVVHMTTQCDYILADYVSITDQYQDCLITTGLPNLMELIKKRHLNVIVSMIDNVPAYAYVFRENQCLYKGEKSITLIATLLCSSNGATNFNAMYRGGIQAIRKAATRSRSGIVCIEMLGLTCKWGTYMDIATSGNEEIPPSPTGYYLYNYACLPLAPQEVTVLL